MFCEGFNNSTNSPCKYRTKGQDPFCGYHRPFNNDPECSICYENIARSQRERLSCGYLFHKMCIFKWDNNTCPLCRSIYKRNSISTEDILDMLVLFSVLGIIHPTVVH